MEVIEYQENSALADGPFSVEFGDVSLIIKSTNE